jgi:hypothetical protein
MAIVVAVLGIAATVAPRLNATSAPIEPSSPITFAAEPAQAGGRFPAVANASAREVGVDELLGKGGRAKHAAALASLKVDGKTHSWSQWSAWGRELYFDAQVKKPPTGPAPSELLSPHYKCTHCHNHVREDRTLWDQDPNVRFAMIEARGGRTPAGEFPLMLAPGTTLWGAVNRESFYNQSFEAYHFLTVPGDREMNPNSLEDATQICGRYCSVGRFMQPWEMTAFMTWYWDMEVKLADLDLPASVEADVLKSLTNPATPADQVTKYRALLRRSHLTRAGADYIHPPKEIGTDTVGPYPDKIAYKGDPAIGARLYKVACDQCHGPDKPNVKSGKALFREPKRFHQVLAHGTSRDDEPYMPMFSARRLSRQQIADIQAYLAGLKD